MQRFIEVIRGDLQRITARTPNQSRRDFLLKTTVVLGGLPTILAGCESSKNQLPNQPTPSLLPRNDVIPTPIPTAPSHPQSSESMPEFSEEFLKLDQERKKRIGRKVEKPGDALPFDKEAINAKIIIPDTNITVSLNTSLPGFQIYFSPFGFQRLAQASHLQNVPHANFHFRAASAIGETNEPNWFPGECKTDVSMPFISMLTDYVLPLFGDKSQWDQHRIEIIEEWNNRMQNLIWHEGFHMGNHFQIAGCTLEKIAPQQQAEIETMRFELESKKHPLAMWFDLDPTESIASNNFISAVLNR